MRKRFNQKNIGVMLDESMYLQLIQVTDENEVPVSKYVRDLIEKDLKEKGGKQS